MDEAELKRVVEAILLVCEKPVPADQISASVAGTSPAAVEAALEALEREWAEANRGFRLQRIAGGYQLMTDPALADPVRTFVAARERKKLSAAALETLSIIAYRQPITRQQIEYIRGVGVEGAMKTLLDRGLIKISGRKDVPGRPLLYSTTKEFLNRFGLGTLKDLPKLAEFTEKDIQLPASFSEASVSGVGEVSEDSSETSEESGDSDQEESVGSEDFGEDHEAAAS